MRGRDSNREKIFNWRIEGSKSVNYTTIFIAPNPTYLGNMVQHFPVETLTKFIYYRRYCLEAEPRHLGLTCSSLYILIVRPLLIIGDEGNYLRVICPVPSLTAVHVSSVHVYLCVCA